MILLSLVFILSSLVSHTAIILVFCLCFYYIFFFNKDNIKTKITNILIFTIPFLIIFIPHVFLVCKGTYNIEAFKDWQNSYIKDFKTFKTIVCYLLGNINNNEVNYTQPVLSFCTYENFYYLFIPIVIGTCLILIKKEWYLFSLLILPVIIAEVLGITNLYPLANSRVSLWLIPIFIILFVIPIRYIKVKNKIFLILLYVLCIIYYLFIFDKTTVQSVKDFYVNGYNYHQNMMQYTVNTILNSDIQDEDIIVCPTPDICSNIILFDKDKKIKNQLIWIKKLVTNKDNRTYYFIFIETNMIEDGPNIIEFVRNNMNIIYEYKTWYGGYFIKAKNKYV